MNKYFDTFYDWWKNIDKTIFLIISLLFSLGLFFSLVSTSIIASDKLNTNSYYFFLKHLIFVLIGIFLILFLSLLEQKILIRLSVVLFVITFISLFLVAISELISNTEKNKEYSTKKLVSRSLVLLILIVLVIYNSQLDIPNNSLPILLFAAGYCLVSCITQYCLVNGIWKLGSLSKRKN